MATSNLSRLSSLGLEQLRDTLDEFHAKKLNALREKFDNTPAHVKAEAAKNLELRLKELARVGHLKKRKQGLIRGDFKADAVSELSQQRKKYERIIKDMQIAIAKRDEEVNEIMKRIRIESTTLHYESPTRDRSAALRAELDTDSKAMRTIERGEKLEDFNKSENLSVSSAAFRRRTNRVRSNQSLWTKPLRGVGELGSAGYETVQRSSGSIYEAARSSTLR